MAYLMSKNTVSVIRFDAAGVAEAESRGYVLAGACDADGKLTGEPIDFGGEPAQETVKSIAELVEKKSKGKK